MQALGGAALAPSFADYLEAADLKWPVEEGPNTPKICLAPGDGGGPLPPNLQWQTPPADAAGGGGRGGRGFGGGYGGYLAPRNDAPLTQPPAGGQGGGRGQQNVAASYRRIRQLGVTHLLGVGMGPTPWTVENVKRAVETAKEHGLVAYNSMIGIPNSITYGRDTRSKDMEIVLSSIDAAGKGGLTVVEYNWYAHRAIEGYYETVGRMGSGYTAFDYELELLVDQNNIPVQPVYRDEQGRITEATLKQFPNAKKIKFKDLPALPQEGARTLDEMWANISWFLKIAVPAAEKAGVRLALHPNDPPSPISRQSQQIMSTLAGWKKLADIVKSPANGITFDCGVTRELGEDPVAVANYFGSRKQINHVHFRNVLVEKPYEKYQEVFVDNGQVPMFAVMKALVKNKYTGTIYPEHPRALDYDRDRVPPGGRLPGYPGGGGYAGITFSVAYTRAMMQAALESV